jgi:asparagine synthase (glutamine-hydrolysing)
MLQVLPDVLYHLESFDPALVRSAIPNYFLAALCAEHVKVFLTGEGADELYAGYDYLQSYQDPAALHAELTFITYALHNTNLQRADRMSMAYGLEARVPFLDVKSIALAFAIEAEAKLHRDGRPPKALLRCAFQGKLPDAILNRPKEKFSKGAGSFTILAEVAEAEVTDADFAAEQARLQREWNYPLANKEALYYYRTLRQHYADAHIFAAMGRSRSL